MNKGGLSNRIGELSKELDELLTDIKPRRRHQFACKQKFEEYTQRLEDMQAMVYTSLSMDPEVDWENPNPILTTEGDPMPEFELQFRTMLLNAKIQQHEGFQEILEIRDKAKADYYEAEQEVVSLMERIGVRKAQLAALTALARLADGS